MGLPMSPAGGGGGPVRGEAKVTRASQIKLAHAIGQSAFYARAAGILLNEGQGVFALSRCE